MTFKSVSVRSMITPYNLRHLPAGKVTTEGFLLVPDEVDVVPRKPSLRRARNLVNICRIWKAQRRLRCDANGREAQNAKVLTSVRLLDGRVEDAHVASPVFNVGVVEHETGVDRARQVVNGQVDAVGKFRKSFNRVFRRRVGEKKLTHSIVSSVNLVSGFSPCGAKAGLRGSVHSWYFCALQRSLFNIRERAAKLD